MTGKVGETDPRGTRDEGRRRVARADAALDLARSNRDFLAADVADRFEETGPRRARTAHRYAMAQAAFHYAVAVRATALDEARSLDPVSARTLSALTHSAVTMAAGDAARDLNARGARAVRAIGVSVLPGAPLVESGFWALLKRYDGRVSSVPLGDSTDVVVAIVTPAEGAPLPPRTEQPMVVIVPDRATATVISRRGALAVPMSTNGAQLMAVLETVRTVKPTPSSSDPWANASSPLSPRERQVITLICAGLTNPQIATELYLGANSIKTYVRTAYRKMGVTRRADAVRWGFRYGYGTPTTPLTHEP